MPSIMQALYNSVSGLFGFSQSLNTISNNISNMNTPGYRGNSSFFTSVMDEAGTKIAGQGRNLSEGQIEQNGVDTNVAIDGNGLFILKDDSGKTFYTRSGQFEFNQNGVLVDSVNKYKVQGYDAAGTLGDISISSLKTLPAEATTKVAVSGNVTTSDPTENVNSIVVYDAQGTSHTLSLKLTDNSSTTAGSWLVSIQDAAGNSLGTGEVRFNTTGAPLSGYSSVTITPTLGGAQQSIVFDFGTPGGYSGVTNFPGTPSSLAAQASDGHSIIGISSSSFDNDGVLQLSYVNGKKEAGPQLALALFGDEQALQAISGNLYSQPHGQMAKIGRANSTSFGAIDGGSLEMSNVDLTQELANMIVIQRGYQASSRVMTISSDMLQQLYDSTRGG